MIVLTADQDWAPAWATRQLTKRWAAAGLGGTLFVTHEDPGLPALREKGLVELAWHPNFNPGSTQGHSETEVLDFLAQMVPEARGVRAHGLLMSTALLVEYGRRGLVYESSYLLEGTPGLTPAVAWNGVVRLPIYWEDDVQMLHGRAFQLDDLGLGRPGLKIFNFHPVHVALNSPDLHAYHRLRDHLTAAGRPLVEATPEDFERFRTRGVPGTADLLDELLGWLSHHPAQRGGSMGQVARQARAAVGWEER